MYHNLSLSLSLNLYSCEPVLLLLCSGKSILTVSLSLRAFCFLQEHIYHFDPWLCPWDVVAFSVRVIGSRTHFVLYSVKKNEPLVWPTFMNFRLLQWQVKHLCKKEILSSMGNAFHVCYISYYDRFFLSLYYSLCEYMTFSGVSILKQPLFAFVRIVNIKYFYG